MATLSRLFYRFCLYVVPSLIVLARAAEQVTLSDEEPSEINPLKVTAPPLPIYAIAHRVLSVQGVKDAIANGANALETDLRAWHDESGDGWWADHDGVVANRSATASELFEAIAKQRIAGKNITFVWFDLKNPDYCKLDYPEYVNCSIVALQDLAREILHPAGVRVMFGFSGTIGKAYNWICANANKYESIGVEDPSASVKKTFARCTLNDRSQHIMSIGYYDYDHLPSEFGNCELDEVGNHVCKELREAVLSRAFGKVFGWTSSVGQAFYVDKMLGTAGVDGIIYGMGADYQDSDVTRAAFKDISDWVAKTPGRYLAGQDDHPW